MKVLFISDYLFAPYGGAQKSAQAHIQSLTDIVGCDNLDIAAIDYGDYKLDYKCVELPCSRKRKNTINNMLHGRPFLISKQLNQKIYNQIDTKKYDVVFLDNSWFGEIAEYIKKLYPSILVLTYFHGVKYNSRLTNLREKPWHPVMYLDLITSVRNEKKIVKYSDVVLLLNKRDEDELYKRYKRKADYYLPVYFKDVAIISNECINDRFIILFVGGALPFNIRGIRWFIKNVVPYIKGDYELQVVGNSMERLSDEGISDKHVRIIGRVDSLDEYYNNANLAIGPIFEGDGMKTKTAEALMYGKVFLGTDEALCGYSGLDEYKCNTSEEFVSKINRLINEGIPKYSVKMRQLFLDNYSLKMADRVFKNALGLQKEDLK